MDEKKLLAEMPSNEVTDTEEVPDQEPTADLEEGED